jgi:hypothetical protein
MRQERRGFERLLLSTPIRYQQKGSQKFGNSIGKDVSSRGIGFISEDFFPTSTQLIFELRHPKTQEFIKAVGEIVWISNKPHTEKYNIGARFLGPPITVL